MAIERTLGGDRLGSGNKMQLEMHNYERSTHNLSRVWRSSMAPGVLTPFLIEPILNGDSIDINLRTKIRTLPTNAPLFGSFKLQLDVFFCPIRLYNGLLHNNAVRIGMQMNKVFLPKIELPVIPTSAYPKSEIDTYAINPSSLLAYVGIRGVGQTMSESEKKRKFMAVPILAYWDIFKNYYANKQEKNAYVLSGSIDTKRFSEVKFTENQETGEGTVSIINYGNQQELAFPNRNVYIIPQNENVADENERSVMELYDITDNTPENKNQLDYITLYFKPTTGDGEIPISATQIFLLQKIANGKLVALTKQEQFWPTEITNFAKQSNGKYQITKILVYDNLATKNETGIVLQEFPLENIDKARQTILKNCELGNEVIIKKTEIKEANAIYQYPYLQLVQMQDQARTNNCLPLNGLAVKTYQSDLFNNWLDTEWIEGENGISQLTAVSTQNGKFTMDALNLSQKLYNVLNRIAVAGGTYEDWQEAVYGEEALRRAESPIYIGGMSSEIVFDEVVSTADTNTEESGNTPLGSLAGRGIETNSNGGHVEYKAKEPGFLIGIASITPRIDYSQGNKWYTELDSMDDLHKPALDGIGFQDLITQQMSAIENFDGSTKSAGKVPAWIEYMTAYNETFGDFADELKTMFMTLNRRYEYTTNEAGYITIKDLTTYIDPAKYNYAFADASITAQNFWTQIAIDFKNRRKMSAKQIPNL